MAAMEQCNGAAPLVAPSSQNQAARWRKRQRWQRLSGSVGSDGAVAAANLGGSNGNGTTIAAMVSDDDEDEQVSVAAAGREHYAARVMRSRFLAGGGVATQQSNGWGVGEVGVANELKNED
jgi:hypothetical protein